MATSLKHSSKNDRGRQKSTEAQGLVIHSDETKILTNQKTNRTREVEIDGMHVEILPSEGKVKYLGQMFTFVDQETTEIQHRIRCAWSAFARIRQELTSRSYSQRHRLHQVDAVVTPTTMYGAGTWTTTTEHEKMLRTAQRRMLRLVIQTQRKD